jgi:hypothetical protein
MLLEHLDGIKTVEEAFPEQTGEGVFVPVINDGLRPITESIAGLKDTV